MGAAGAYCANGGQVAATIPVTANETLIVTVGGQGTVAKGGGFNGGGAGAKNTKGKDAGASGGGASDVRQGGTTLAHRVIVAGGGGSSSGGSEGGLCGSGGGIPDGGNGGNPLCNEPPSPSPGDGGTQTAGGAGGAGTNGGSLGDGGNGIGSCLYFNVSFSNLHWSGGAQPGVNISGAVTQTLLTPRYNQYQAYQGAGQAPPYIATSMNSNSWADGLLLGLVSQSTIDGWVSTLENKSGLNAPAYKNGSKLLRCFQFLDRILELRVPPPATTCETGSR
jgi:hypothetical protein